MNLIQFHQFIEENEIVDIVSQINEEDFFYFKSKENDLEYLGFGEFISNKQIINKNVPQILLGTFENKLDFLIFDNYILKQNNEYHLNINKIPSLKNIREQKISITTTPIESFIQWETNISKALELIENNHFNKIVLKRDLELKLEPLDSGIAKLLKYNSSNHNYTIYFNINKNKFISFTPEKLLEINNRKIKSMALAGSMPITDVEETNQKNCEILIKDEKLIREHQIVVDEIYDRFNSFSRNVTKSELKIMRLPYIQHRLVEIEADYDESISINEILESIHPTPAVGTLPRKDGIKVINEIENKPRNYYAAPIGLSYSNQINIAVALRSATILDDKLILHSGCGIIKGSKAKNEWDETTNKIAPFLKALV